MKRSKTWGILLTVFIAGFLTACSDDDENPFAGIDNNILSFSLSQGEETWQAAIVDNNIIVSVPQGTELNGATARYTISEQANILPNPASISAWNEEQQLTVTSYNGTSRTYKYTVRHTDVNETGSITLNSQTEVDAFANSRITIIEGNLSIATTENVNDPINNLDGLTALTEVLDDVTIGKFYKGENLNGLANLKKAGSMTILPVGANLETLTSISLPSLISIRKTLTINSGKYFEKVSLPLLEIVNGAFTIDATGMKQFNLNSLKKVGGNFTIKESQLSQLELPTLEIVEGSYFSIESDYNNSKLLEISLPKLASCQSIKVSNANKLENLKLSELKSVKNEFTIDRCAMFDDESIKNAISNIGNIGTLHFIDTKVFNLDVQGKAIGTVRFEYAKGEDTSKQVNITGSEPFGSIVFGAKQMDPPTVKGFTTVENYSLSSNIQEGLTIKGIKHINGNLTVKYFGEQGMPTDALGDIHLPDLEYAGSVDVNLNVNIKATAFDAPNLKTIEKDIYFSDLYDLQTDFSYIKMPELQTIGALRFTGSWSGNSKIDEIDINKLFPNLENSNSVTIENFPRLYNFSSFKKFITNGKIEKWDIYGCGYDPSLQEMKESTGDFSDKKNN